MRKIGDFNKDSFISIKIKIYIVITILSLIYNIILNCFSGGISFSIFWLALAIMFFILTVFNIKYKKGVLDYLPKIMKNIVRSVVFILLISFVFIEGMIIINGSNVQDEAVDYYIILGAGLYGERMSLTLYERMKTSIPYIKENNNSIIVVSGGQGPGETIPEAEAMKRYLIEQDVNENRVIKEEKSTSTYENIKYSKEKIIEFERNKGKEYGIAEDISNLNITVITTDFHMMRAKLLCKNFGIKANGIPASLYPLLKLNYYVREYFAVIKTMIFDIGMIE